VSIPPGTHHLGQETGTLSVRTGRTGAAAKAGHNLVIEVTAWSATLEVGAEPSQTTVELSADATSLRVREGHGGMQALGDEDRENIQQTIDDEVLKRQDVVFRSTQVAAAGDGLSIQGDLTLVGTTHPISFELEVGDDGALSASAVITQSSWGMKPYSALFGALKVADDVEVLLTSRLEVVPEPVELLGNVAPDAGAHDGM
jgi:polyisoprenoid-binding protein YceI